MAGALKRKAKSAVIPFYGTKGMGLIKEPKKANYNAVYKRTSFGLSDLIKKLTK
jgi:hypothetical protein